MNLGDAYIVMTRGFTDLDEKQRVEIMEKTFASMHKTNTGWKPDFVIFDNKTYRQEQFEDGGRSLRIGMPGLDEKVYAKIDDYGSKEFLSEQVGRRVNTQYVITFMLAQEY